MSLVIKCEMCDHSYPLDPLQRPHERDVPDEWLTLVRGNLRTNAGFDFCSEQCLLQWMTGNIAQPQADKPEYKACRFLLRSKNDTSDEVEGVAFLGGSIYLDPHSSHCSSEAGYDSRHCYGCFHGWNEFFKYHADYEIIWIDQERNV